MTMDEVKMGIYRHWNGPLYQVLGIAHDANADALYDYDAVVSAEMNGGGEALGQRTVVVYMPLQLDGAHPEARMCVRTLEDFLGVVHGDGSYCFGDKRCQNAPPNVISRFTYLGQELTKEMMC
jgi:hypothetical protein